MGSPKSERVKRIERILEKQDRSISWLSRKTNVSVSYAWMMLNGERPLTDEFRASAAEALGVPEDILFAETTGTPS